MKKNNLCLTCTKYVVCKNKNASFCLCKDLFTHTEVKTSEGCIDYSEGKPTTEKEYDRGWCE